MKRNINTITIAKSKGEITMKKSIIILVLVTAFVLSFGVVAGAKYAGFTPIRTQADIEAGKVQGTITFPEAVAEMGRNAASPTLQKSAHGGYVTTTTKCAVCHSAHRASGINAGATEGIAAASNNAANLANSQSQKSLTDGATTCAGCHVGSGAQASTLLVEWATTGAGPHSGTSGGRACELCHNAGIHGLASSKYNVMNVFMLGNGAGAGKPKQEVNRDALIAKDLATNKIRRGGVLDTPIGASEVAGPVVASPAAGTTWWYDGTRALGATGTTPGSTLANATATTGFSGAPNALQYSAARSLATAYTCMETGCHTNTQMFNLNWGMGFEKGGSDVTAHVLPMSEHGTCGPCHVGGVAGFPTSSTNVGVADVSRKAYGCDQCHDMVGVATNSTAFPHGNRNIQVYEWQADGTQVVTTATAGNLWMYGGSIQLKAGATAANNYLGQESDPVRFADASWKVLTDVTGGLKGTGTGLQDGACLKCHISIDKASLEASGGTGVVATRSGHAWGQGSLAAGYTYNGTAPTNSSRLFLYK